MDFFFASSVVRIAIRSFHCLNASSGGFGAFWSINRFNRYRILIRVFVTIFWNHILSISLVAPFSFNSQSADTTLPIPLGRPKSYIHRMTLRFHDIYGDIPADMCVRMFSDICGDISADISGDIAHDISADISRDITNVEIWCSLGTWRPYLLILA